MKLIIEDVRGVWKAELNGRCEFGDTLEDLLLKLAPDAPLDYVYHSGEVLGGILGATVVELPCAEDYESSCAEAVEVPQYVPDSGFADWFTSALQELEGVEPQAQSWQPTDAQRAYFETEDDGA